MNENLLEGGPEELAVQFLSNFIEVSEDEIRELDMTRALANMFSALVAQTLAFHFDNKEKIVLH
tara:strand:- start:797 stop:988 length:192 start_codon:yes stop_codon:yes gene_type:complete